MIALTVAQVEREVRRELAEFSDEVLAKIVSGYRVDSSKMSRPEMVKVIVDAEVYAFIH